MTDIPVSFKFEGKQYSGVLQKVSGSASTAMFYLMVDNRFLGQLFYSQYPGDEWQFHSPSMPGLHSLSSYFGMVVTSWFDGAGGVSCKCTYSSSITTTSSSAKTSSSSSKYGSSTNLTV